MANLKTLIDSINSRAAIRLVDTAYPKNESDELFLILRGFTKSLVGEYWVLYEQIN